jgi:hypothetical protein
MDIDVTSVIQEDLRWMLCANLHALDVAAEIVQAEGQPEESLLCDPAKCSGIMACAVIHNLSPQMRSAVAHYAELADGRIRCTRSGATDV